MLANLALVSRAIAETTKKGLKEEILAAYLNTLDDGSLERAVVFFAGSPFPRREERVTGAGWATVADAFEAATGLGRDQLDAAVSRTGDLGDALAEVWPQLHPVAPAVTVIETGELFDALSEASGGNQKTALLAAFFRKLSGDEARVVAKILLKEFRIGLQEGLVESAIAKAFGRPLTAVRRAHMFSGDLGTTALLARSGALESATLQLFHPIAFMLAQPEENPQRIVDTLGSGAFADDKFDGIRAQIHISDGKVRIYSRTLDEISTRFPEVAAAAAGIAGSAILDGEIVAFSDRILPFAVIQKRLGRKKVSEKLLADAPALFFAFDLLYRDGEPLFERPLSDRIALLELMTGLEGTIRRSIAVIVHSGEEVDAAFDRARARANEGLVVKDPGSLYTPGRRGKTWLKYKKALATLDCVITAAEYGHGKRRAVLSDYTFAVSRDGELVNIGKAYSGLTDVEIDHLTARLTELTTARYGPVHVVKPEIVLEIAFDRIQESARHKSGYAMRFPRIVSIRDDKNAAEISTIDEVRRIYEGQLVREGGESI